MSDLTERIGLALVDEWAWAHEHRSLLVEAKRELDRLQAERDQLADALEFAEAALSSTGPTNRGGALRRIHAALTAIDKGDERIAAEREFLAASVAVWREIDRLSVEPGGYRGLAPETDLRQRERAAWDQYRAAIDKGEHP